MSNFTASVLYSALAGMILLFPGNATTAIAEQAVLNAAQTPPAAALPRDARDIEIIRLKQENELLRKELAGTRRVSPTVEPPAVRPASMAEQDFIDSHRSYQDSQCTIEGVKHVYPGALILRYRKLLADHPKERAFSYLSARILPAGEKNEAITAMINTYPKYSYGYRLKWQYLLHEKNPPDCKAALVSAEKEKALDPEAELNDVFAYAKQCVTGEVGAPSLQLTFDSKSIKQDKDSYTAISVAQDHSITVKKRLLDKITNTKIRLEYAGMTQLSGRPEFHFKIRETGDYRYLRLLLVAKQGLQIINKSMSLSTADFSTGNGAADVYIGVEDMANLKEIQIEE